MEKGHRLAMAFISVGNGGPRRRAGREMGEAHKVMNIRAQEFVAVIDAIL